MLVWPERRTGCKGAALFAAAKRPLAVEHRSGIHTDVDGRRSGNTFLLVGSEQRFGRTTEPMTAEVLSRRLITLIFAGRNRMAMIRRELPRTRRAGWGRSPFRIKD